MPMLCTRLLAANLALLSIGYAQKPVEQKPVTITVVDAHADPAQPVPAVQVSLTYLDGSHPTIEARDVTNPRGQAFLQVSTETIQRDDLRLVIDGKPNLVIFEPADGQLHGLSSAVPVKLLPQGSAALLGPAQIEALQRRLSQNVARLKAKTDRQKKAVTEGFDDWVKAVGVDRETAKKAILDWAEELKAEPVSRGLFGEEPGVSAERRALAAFALEDYGDAADLFGQASGEEMAAADIPVAADLPPEQQQRNGLLLQRLVQSAKQQANALQMLARYHDATQALTKVRDFIEVRHLASPGDALLSGVWEDVSSEAANAQLAENASGAPKQ